MTDQPRPPAHIPLNPYTPLGDPAALSRAFYTIMNQRRSVRQFSDTPVSRETIEWCIRAAGTAPSGANKQPWRFVAVADPVLKHQIRVEAEKEEHEFYTRRAPSDWLQDLAPFGTDPSKPFLDIAPWLVVVFKLMKTDPDPAGHQGPRQGKVYYVEESVGIATGLFLAACHHAGLATLTHTPSPMAFLTRILNRPDYERPFLLIPVGYPAPNCTVPDITRKDLSQISAFHE